MHAVAIQPSIFVFYYRGSLRLKKLKHGEIIHFLVWCHLRLSIIAGVRRLVSIIGRDTANSLRRHCRWVLVDSLFCHKIEAGGHQKENHFSSLFFFSCSFFFVVWKPGLPGKFYLSVCCSWELVAFADWCGVLEKGNDRSVSQKSAVIQHILNVCW